ncbi:MAG: response regulator [Candidatus Omnitrophica bacterium]|nr:response regulator [Candidatus Omnitrophota bacterium]
MKTILLVEDTEDYAENLKYVLEQEGYRVVIVMNGKDGLEKAMHIRPDLILMDVLMPVLDGVQATALIREHTELKDIPVIFLTAVTAGDNVVMNVQGKDFPAISKMADQQQLLAKIRQYVGD